MRVNREHVLQVLESVGFGVARTPTFQQSGCLAFDDGKVITFNGDVACSGESPLNGVRGAVPAATFMEYLRKLTEEELTIDGEDGFISVKGKGHRIKFAMEKEVQLPLDQIEPPGEWTELHEDFCEAASMVADCASKDNSKFEATCVHVHPQWVEAFDGTQMMRHRIKSGITEPFLIQKTAVKHACLMGMSHWNLTDRWVHFRNNSGYVLSSLRFPDMEYYDLTPRFKLEGEKISLPKGLAQIAAYAELASKESKDENVVTVTLRPGEVVIRAKGIVTEYEARRKIAYAGPEMQFCIAPTLLGVLADKYNEAKITPYNLVVDGGKWRYAVMLNLPS